MPFWSEYETFDKESNIEHKQIPKNILTDYESYHGTHHFKSLFLVFACADVLFFKNRSSKALFGPK